MTDDTTETDVFSPFISPDTPMLSKVIAQVDELDGLSASRRRDLKSALRGIGRLLGKDLEEIPANINWLQVRLRRVQPAAHDLSAKRFANIKSDALKALELTGCSRARADWLREPSPAWAALLDHVNDKHDQWRLTQLAQFCSARGVEPREITDAEPRGLLEALINESFQNRPKHVVANAIATWNRLKDTLPGWPDITLTKLPRTKKRWTYPIETFPDSFQGDVAAWCERLANPDLLDASGPGRPLRPVTVSHRRFQIQEAASALVRTGKPIDSITSLAVIVELGNLKAALRWMMDRFDGKPTEAIKGVAVCLQSIARHHVGQGDDDIDVIRGIVRRLGRDADGLREKNRQRLLQLEDTQNLMKLLHLPAALASKAQRMRASKPRKAALLLQTALAIEILLNAPLRIGNLASLHLERHLRTVRRGRKREIHVHIPADEVKNNKALDHVLNPEVTAMLELYLAVARPFLIMEHSAYLFPAMDGGHKRPNDLSARIRKTILEHTGLEINAHLFRSIAGKIHSLTHPGDAVTLSYLLNDSLTTTMKSYAQFERRSALEHYQRSLARARSAGGTP